MDPENIFFVVFGCVVAYGIFSVFRHGSFKGAMFGARVVSFVGEVSGPKRGVMSQKLKVHVLDAEGPADPAVGIELTSSGPGSWSMTPISLTSSDAQRLIRLLEQATNSEFRARSTPAA